MTSRTSRRPAPRPTTARAARANFLASDRPDIAFAVKELCRGMSAPTARDPEALKRLARYLLGKPRVVFHYAWQRAPESLDVYTDSDWAGCVKTRKSTTGGALLRGRHVLKTWSGTQATIALSSAEAELIAAGKGAAEGLAVRSLVRDFGRNCALRVHVDSSAAISICRRTGAGKVRHLDTRLLWVQELVRDGTIEVIKVAGTVNPADLMTKHLPAEAISANLTRLDCFEREGRNTGHTPWRGVLKIPASSYIYLTLYSAIPLFNAGPSLSAPRTLVSYQGLGGALSKVPCVKGGIPTSLVIYREASLHRSSCIVPPRCTCRDNRAQVTSS